MTVFRPTTIVGDYWTVPGVSVETVRQEVEELARTLGAARNWELVEVRITRNDGISTGTPWERIGYRTESFYLIHETSEIVPAVRTSDLVRELDFIAPCPECCSDIVWSVQSGVSRPGPCDCEAGR